MSSNRTASAGDTALHLGIDIGSISINTVILDETLAVVENRYDYCHGRPFALLKQILDDIGARIEPDRLHSLSLTGSGGKRAAELIGGSYTNEVIAQSQAVARMYPHARTIIEIGGEDSKLISMDSHNGCSRLSDFELNTICAAGTGSFLDQQARRIGISIENEFGELALQSTNPPRIAGRCSVFAKSDMIHLQQLATPVHDIVAGLCFAVARNFISTLARGKSVAFPIVFQGGVAANAGMVRAFSELLQAAADELIIPEYHASMGAIGAVLQTLSAHDAGPVRYQGSGKLEEYLLGGSSAGKSHEPLRETETVYVREPAAFPAGVQQLDVYLGLDVGSLSTNIVLIDDKDNVIARRYLPTASKPIDAIRHGMAEIAAEIGHRVTVRGAGTTGSGRYLTGDFIGADVIRNEITAQATAAIAFDSKVDTVFEIGGQDSKYISIDNGVVVDFEMNKVCAAGTGSFLEEQAEKLDISIDGEFGRLALGARKPAALGDRCTVFMESDLNSCQQKGTRKDDLVAGLAYSIVQNYILKVVRKKRIGDHILFQGGVTNNKAVVAAFGKVTGKKIHVPPHFDCTGAIGTAMLARKHVRKNGCATRFKGFDISRIPYALDRFTCRHCSNQCEIRRVRIEGEERPLYYGGRCERYEKDDRKGKGRDIPNHFAQRLEMLLDGYTEEPADARTSIGIPRALTLFYQQFPFWRTFFSELGFRVVISAPTDNQIIRKSLDTLVAETCFPVEVMHGHIHDLLQKRVDYIFTPFVINTRAEPGNPTSNCNCPWIQTYPFMVKAGLSAEAQRKLLVPALNFRYWGRVLDKELSDFFSEKLGVSAKRVRRAVQAADERQAQFERSLEAYGQRVLNSLPADKQCLVIMGRQYNTGDPALNLGMVEKLINLDVVPIPMDFLPLASEYITQDYPQMYWPNGQRILAAARIIARDRRLHAVYMGNFRCGPDSFLAHFVHEEMAGKPYLEIEIDEHSADAGMITRYEAFLDSLKGLPAARRTEVIRPKGMVAAPIKDRVLYFPYMCDGAYAVAAASRSCGIHAEVLPMQNEEDLELGRKYTSARECFPMICTTGSFLKKLMEPGVDPSKISFFMPDHNGPCRFGQYNRLQRVIFDRLGFRDVKVISPSNDTSYEDISGGRGTKFRYNAWRGLVAVDLLRKLKQECTPYELVPGSTEEVYRRALRVVERSVERGADDLTTILHDAAQEFSNIALVNGFRKPVISVVGEIFMRDNAFCSGFLVKRLEAFGAETVIAPFAEWLSYSTYRYTRDSLWKGDYRGVLKSKLQEFTQDVTAHKLRRAVHGRYDEAREVELHQMLDSCAPYIHRHYDGDPALNLGSSVALARTGISGIANILPFTCMPGTIVACVSDQFKRDHDGIPYVSIAYDGQEDTSIDLRLQAFMHQAKEFAKQRGCDLQTHLPGSGAKQSKKSTTSAVTP